MGLPHRPLELRAEDVELVMDNNAGILSVVGTPIGNLEDVSGRVIDTLGRADAILCEDTRVTSRLLAHFGIQVPLVRADENVIESRVASALERVGRGERVAFVSDAGMPCVSDPGQRLVDAALDAGLPVEVIPGPSSVTCAVAASGLHAERFFFEGFLPRKRGPKERRLELLSTVPGSLVILESPRRVADTVASIARVMPTRRVALVRELTKVHEECVRDVATSLAKRLEGAEAKGECVLVVEMPTDVELQRRMAPVATLEEAIGEALRTSEPKSAIAKRLAKEYGLSKSEVYDRMLELG